MNGPQDFSNAIRTAFTYDNTPIMQAVLVALKRGAEIGQGSPVATS